VVSESSLDNQGCCFHVLIAIGVNCKLNLSAKLSFAKFCFLS